MTKTSMVSGIAALLLAGTVSAADSGASGKAELAERKKDMDAELAALKKRLTRVPANIDAVRADMTRIAAAKGINATGIVFGPAAALQAMAENRRIDIGDGNAFDALVTFSKDLKARGVDFMVVPYPTHAEVYGHRLYEGGKPDDELWPAKVEGLIKLIENDVEVIECGDAFKAYTGKGRLMGPLDHHFDSAGIEIVAKELGRRIRKRYDFAKAGEGGRKLFTTQEVQVGTPDFFLYYNKINAEEAAALNIPPTLPVQQVTYSGKVDLGNRIDPVFVMGDSSVPHGEIYPQGWGIMPHLSKELGWLVPYTSDNGGAHKQCVWYARQYANKMPQPRVLILVMVGYSLYFNDAFLGRWSIAPMPLVLSGPGVFRTRELNIGSAPGTSTARSTASLLVPEDSTLEKIVVTDAFRIASSTNGNWSAALEIGYETDGETWLTRKEWAKREAVIQRGVCVRNWMLPDGISFEIGSREKPASEFTVGLGTYWAARGCLVAGAGGVFSANATLMQIGCMIGAGSHWYGAIQAEIKLTPPFSIGNDHWGILDLSRMERCDITVGELRVGHAAVAADGAQLVGQLLLPKGHVSAGSVIVGHAFPVCRALFVGDPEWHTADAFRVGTEGRLELNGTVLSVGKSLAIPQTGVVNVYVSETSAGPDLAADADLSIGGALNIVFKGLPNKAGRFYGLRWKGDQKKRLNELIKSKAITIDAEALGANAAQVNVFTGTEDVNGAAVTFTYVGLADAPAGSRPIAPTPPLPAKPAAAAKPAVAPADEGPFRATVTLTKVSVPPDPTETPYKDAFTVSEGRVTELLSKTDEVKVGDTVLLVEWVMKEREVLAPVARQKAGDTRTVTLTRWEKKLNAAEDEARMIMDDTENYDARMYWVGEMKE